jgi:hypothetical protein
VENGLDRHVESGTSTPELSAAGKDMMELETEYDTLGKLKHIDPEHTDHILYNSIGAGEVFTMGPDKRKFVRRVIALASRSTTDAESRYGISKLEAAGLAYALKEFGPFVRCLTIPLRVYTDHKSLTGIFRTDDNMLYNTLNTYAETIMSINLELVYIPGVHNTIPDLLSRMYVHNRLDKLGLSSESEGQENVHFKYTKLKFDESDLVECLDKGEQQRLLEMEHEKGHFGSGHIVRSIKRNHHKFWKFMHSDAVQTCRHCDACARHQVQLRGFAPLTPIQAELPWDLVGFDVAHL